MNTQYKIVMILTLTGLLLGTSCSPDETQKVATFENLVMSDEFDEAGTPNSELWNFEIGRGTNGWGNNELQYYTDRPENVKVQNGMLVITARQEAYQGAQYTSARLTTKGKFEQTYGRYEARIKLPYGKGIWPAFWLLGDDENGTKVWPEIGEIDIMEYLGDAPAVAFGTVHGPGYSAGESISKSYDLVNDRFDTGFHVFGIEWGHNYINFYIDDVLYNQITPQDVPGEWVFNDGPFYIILNMAIGGNLPGAPNSETVFPQSMYVDYIRVYNK